MRGKRIYLLSFSILVSVILLSQYGFSVTVEVQKYYSNDVYVMDTNNIYLIKEEKGEIVEYNITVLNGTAVNVFVGWGNPTDVACNQMAKYEKASMHFENSFKIDSDIQYICVHVNGTSHYHIEISIHSPKKEDPSTLLGAGICVSMVLVILAIAKLSEYRVEKWKKVGEKRIQNKREKVEEELPYRIK